jgi:hypothetical protein
MHMAIPPKQATINFALMASDPISLAADSNSSFPNSQQSSCQVDASRSLDWCRAA